MALTPYDRITWKDHLTQNPNRRGLIPVDGQENVFDVEKQQGTVLQAGTPLSATNLNRMDKAIYDVTEEVIEISGGLEALTTAVGGKAASSHTHTIANVTGLTDALAQKASATPTFARTATLTDLQSEEELSVSLGKLSRAVYDFIAHKSATNPHAVTKAQVGLGNVENTAANTASSANTIAKRDASGDLSVYRLISTAIPVTGAATGYMMYDASGITQRKPLASVKAELVVASEILTKLKTVHGTGSGLDADKLDGQEATAFAPSSLAGAVSDLGGRVGAAESNIATIDPRKGLLAESTDLDSVEVPGTYYFQTETTIYGKPEGVTFGWLIVFKAAAGSTSIAQMIIGQSAQVFVRRKSQSGFGDWHTFLSSADQAADSAKLNGQSAAYYAASDHSHEISSVAGLQAALDGKAATSHTHSAYSLTEHKHSGADITSGTVPFERLPTGTGAANVATGNHTHAIANVTGLQTALDGKSDSSHTHAVANITGLQTLLDGKSATGHVHTIANVTGLQTAIDGKAASEHTHTIANVTGLQTAIDGKAATSHTHTIANVTGLQTALDGKSGTGHTHTSSAITDLWPVLYGSTVPGSLQPGQIFVLI